MSLTLPVNCFEQKQGGRKNNMQMAVSAVSAVSAAEIGG
jgi:hypothetical protein